MALPFPIAATQTDAKSPIDQQLMDALRLNQEFLDTQIGGASAGGILNFRVNGYLIRIREILNLGAGKRLDGGILSNAVTFTQAKLYLEKGGISGSLEVDVLRHKELQHPIENILSQYKAATQAIGRLGSPENTQAISIATPIVSTQVITKPIAAVNVETVADLGSDDFLYTFSGTGLLGADYEIGDSILFDSLTNAANDGEFIIKQVNFDGLPSVVINNPSGVEQNAAAGDGTLSVYEFTYLALIDDDYVVGEDVILAGHTLGANDGTKTIYKTNQAGNNIWFKYAGGDVQGGVAGTAQVTRWVYTFSAAVDTDHYFIGEKAEFNGHSAGANDGSFIIRRVNGEAANNLYVTNVAGVAQGGAAGTADTLRWLYSMPTDPSTDSDVQVGDNVIFTNHTAPANDGTYDVKTVNRNAVDNLEIYNENGVVQAGIAGEVNTVLRVVTFKTDFSADFIAGTSRAALEGLKSITGDLVPEYNVVEINRGVGLFNIVIDAEAILEQVPSSGRVAREVRSIFLVRPKLTTAQPNQIRNMQTDDNATFTVGGVEADTILTLEFLEVPEGLPSTMVLSLL